MSVPVPNVFYLPFNKMLEHTETARSDSDTAFFFHLLYSGEMLTKIVAAGFVAAVDDDADRHRYRQLHKIVHADGLGDWRSVIDEILAGPSAQFLNSELYEEQRELMQKSGKGTWQYDAISLLHRSVQICDPSVDALPGKVQGRMWFELFVRLRNSTRGHGAPSPDKCSRVCPSLKDSVDLFFQNHTLFKRQWAFLFRNLSGKYRLTPWSKDSSLFQTLKTSKARELPNLRDGAYIHLGAPLQVDLIQSDQDATDFFFQMANGTELNTNSFRTSATIKRLVMLDRMFSPLVGCRKARLTGVEN